MLVNNAFEMDKPGPMFYCK